MPMRDRLARLVHRNPERPTLRQRAAALKASAAKVMRRPASAAPPANVEAAPVVLPGTDAEFLRLEREWDEAREREEAGYARQREIVSADPGPGPAPEGMPEWREFHQKVREWRDSSGLEEAEEDAKHWCGVVDDIAQQIAALPATSLTGMRVKARVLCYFEEIEIDPVRGLVGGLARDVLALAPDALPEDARALALVDALEREWGQWSVEQARDYLDVSPEASARADVRSDRREILLEAAIALPATSRAARHAKALAHAWIGLVESWRYLKPREGYQFDGLLAFDIDAALATANGPRSGPPADPPISAPYGNEIARALMQSIDLGELSLRELASLATDAETLAGVAWGVAALPRQTEGGAGTPVGRLFESLACAAGEVVWRAQQEAKARTPIGHLDRECRAKAIALPVIEDGNPDDLEALAADLLKEAARVRRGEAEAVADRG